MLLILPTSKVMDAEKKRTASEKEHLSKSAAFTEIEAKVKTLEKKLSRHIEKSKPYFEGKDVFNKALEAEKARVQQLQVAFLHFLKVLIMKKFRSASLLLSLIMLGV